MGRPATPRSQRSPLLRIVAAALAGLLLTCSWGDSLGFVAVLGAGGKTGSACVEALLARGVPAAALTRSGTWAPNDGGAVPAGELTMGRADVTDYGSLKAALQNASAVIWAAAYSRGKSLPKDVDNAGLVNTARAVKELGVPRLVVVSSAATTRPYAPVGVLLNVIGSGVLMEKLQGEKEMQGLLSNTGSTYTILKPGGLKQGPANGISKLEFNQGDTLVGSIQRRDVAEVAVAAALDPENRGAGKTFELYEAASRNPLLPWYSKESKYAVAGRDDAAAMFAELLPDGQVNDVPGFLPF